MITKTNTFIKGFMISLSFFLFLNGCATKGINLQNIEANIEGEWSCKYIYNNGDYKNNGFSMHIETFENELVNSKTTEPRVDFGPENMSELIADISGTINFTEGTIKFEKKYTYEGGHSIYYNGYFLSTVEMKGSWRNLDNLTGRWSCTR